MRGARCIALIAAAVLATASDGAMAGGPVDGRLRRTCAIDPTCSRPIPKLTSASARRAIRALQRSGLLRLFHDAPHKAAVGPWTTAGAHERLLGAAVFLRFAEPVSGSGAWPVVGYPHHPTAARPYATRVVRGTFAGVTEASVLIATHSQRAVDLTFADGHWTTR